MVVPPRRLFRPETGCREPVRHELVTENVRVREDLAQPGARRGTDALVGVGHRHEAPLRARLHPEEVDASGLRPSQYLEASDERGEPGQRAGESGRRLAHERGGPGIALRPEREEVGPHDVADGEDGEVSDPRSAAVGIVRQRFEGKGASVAPREIESEADGLLSPDRLAGRSHPRGEIAARARGQEHDATADSVAVGEPDVLPLGARHHVAHASHAEVDLGGRWPRTTFTISW